MFGFYRKMPYLCAVFNSFIRSHRKYTINKSKN